MRLRDLKEKLSLSAPRKEIADDTKEAYTEGKRHADHLDSINAIRFQMLFQYGIWGQGI